MKNNKNNLPKEKINHLEELEREIGLDILFSYEEYKNVSKKKHDYKNSPKIDRRYVLILILWKTLKKVDPLKDIREIFVKK